MAKKKNKKGKTPNNVNHNKSTKAVKSQTKPKNQPKSETKVETKVEPKVKEQAPKNNVFKKAFSAVGSFFKKSANSVKGFFVRVGAILKKWFLSIKSFALKSVVIWNFIKNHKKIFGGVLVVFYTAAIVFSTLGVEHYILPLVLPESVETTQDEAVEIKQFKMEQGQVYRVSPDFVLQYEGYEFTNTIRPKNVEKAGEYFGQSYVNENEDNIYLDIIFKYTNRSDVPVRGDQLISAVTTADGKSYEDIFIAIENKDGTDIDFSSSVEIAPGDYTLVHCVFDVPKETENLPGIKTEVMADDKSYIITIGEQTESEPVVERPEPEQIQRQTLTK